MLPSWRAGIFDDLLGRVLGLAPLLLPWFAGNIDGFSYISALDGKGKKERNFVLYFSDFCCSFCIFGSRVCLVAGGLLVLLRRFCSVQGCCSCVTVGLQAERCSSYMVCSSVGSCACLRLKICLRTWLRISDLRDIRRSLQHQGAAAWWTLSAASIAFMCMVSFVRGFFLVVVITLEELYGIWVGAAAFCVCCNKMTAAATMCAALAAAAFWGSLVLVVESFLLESWAFVLVLAGSVRMGMFWDFGFSSVVTSRRCHNVAFGGFLKMLWLWLR